jgi:acyl-CoA thioester hydrolase
MLQWRTRLGLQASEGKFPLKMNNLELPITYRGVVYPWQCDQVGHMNVSFYTAKFDEATWQLFAMIGITPSYLRNNGRGMAALTMNTTFKRELCPGDVVTIRSAILSIKDKFIQFKHHMYNDETRELSATTTITGVHMDTEIRKSCPFPVEIIASARNSFQMNEPGGLPQSWED